MPVLDAFTSSIAARKGTLHINPFFETQPVKDGIPVVPDAVAILCVQDAKESTTEMPPVVQIPPPQQHPSRIKAHEQRQQIAQPDGHARQEDEGSLGVCMSQQLASQHHT